MKVGIVGGTGKFGLALARRLLDAGDDVMIGSRDPDRARASAAELGGSGGANQRAAGFGEIVILAVPAYDALKTLHGLRDSLSAPILSVGSPIDFAGGMARPVAETKSLAEQLSEASPVPVVAGLHTLAARKLERERPDEDAFVCGNDSEAKAIALELASHVVAGRALDAGPLQVARALEAMTAPLLNLNRSHKTHTGLRVTGLP